MKVASLALVCGYIAILLLNRRRAGQWDGNGDASRGIVLFVEPVRWLFVIWGFGWFCSGLRRAGGRQQVRLFRWSSAAGALLVVPDLVRQGRLDWQAQRLARLIARLEEEHAGVPIHVVGYSTGAYVAAEACKRAPRSDTPRRLILLAASASPDYDWSGLRTLSVYSFYSPLDAINVVGPLLFGANDRRWGPAGGAVGFRQSPGFLRQRSWTWSDLRLGYLGDHFTVTIPSFVARHVAPLLISD